MKRTSLQTDCLYQACHVALIFIFISGEFGFFILITLAVYSFETEVEMPTRQTK